MRIAATTSAALGGPLPPQPAHKALLSTRLERAALLSRGARANGAFEYTYQFPAQRVAISVANMAAPAPLATCCSKARFSRTGQPC